MPNPEHEKQKRILKTTGVFLLAVSGLLGLNKLVDEEKPKIVNVDPQIPEMKETWTPKDLPTWTSHKK